MKRYILLVCAILLMAGYAQAGPPISGGGGGGSGDFLADGSVPMTGNLAMGTHDITGIGSLAATGARSTKGWFTNLEITNYPTVNGAAVFDQDVSADGNPSFSTINVVGANSLNLGTAGSLVGGIRFKNATSGYVEVLPPAGALGTGAITLPASGTLLTLALPVTHSATEAATAATMYGNVHLVTGNYTITLPTAVAGMNAKFCSTTAAVFYIDTAAGDKWILAGTATDDGDKIGSPGSAGDCVDFVSHDATVGWMTMFMNVVFVDSGA